MTRMRRRATKGRRAAELVEQSLHRLVTVCAGLDSIHARGRARSPTKDTPARFSAGALISGARLISSRSATRLSAGERQLAVKGLVGEQRRKLETDLSWHRPVRRSAAQVAMYRRRAQEPFPVQSPRRRGTAMPADRLLSSPGCANQGWALVNSRSAWLARRARSRGTRGSAVLANPHVVWFGSPDEGLVLRVPPCRDGPPSCLDEQAHDFRAIVRLLRCKPIGGACSPSTYSHGNEDLLPETYPRRGIAMTLGVRLAGAMACASRNSRARPLTGLNFFPDAPTGGTSF